MESAWCNEPPLAFDMKLLLFVLIHVVSTALRWYIRLTLRHPPHPLGGIVTSRHPQPTRLQAFEELYRYSQLPQEVDCVTGYQIATSLVLPSSAEQASFLRVSYLLRPT
jgi:hypothetical protein